MRILIYTIPHSAQRYPTVGDWRFDANGDLEITVSRMSDPRYEFLIGLHELVEAMLCKQLGISQTDVDKFDKRYEERRKVGDDSEPGASAKAPYHMQHKFATKIERLTAAKLGVDWAAYGKEVASK